MIFGLPVALLLETVTILVALNDVGLPRTSVGCTSPSPSLTLYADWLKDMVAAKKHYNHHVKNTLSLSNSRDRPGKNGFREFHTSKTHLTTGFI